MKLTARHGRLALTLRVLRLGRDLQVICSGGQAHIGAVAVASPLPPHAQKTEHHVQLMSLPGHREDMLAARMARHLADPRAHLHLYGKAEAREGRKMGHVTRVG